MRLYYNIANKVAYRIFVHGLGHEDKVQECVLKAWLALGMQPNESLIPLIYTIMKNHLIALSRPTYASRKLVHYTGEEITLYKNPYTIVIPLPVMKDEKVIVLAWLEHNGSLKVACETLGIGYWAGVRLWKKAKATLREKGMDNWSIPYEQCWLCNHVGVIESM